MANILAARLNTARQFPPGEELMLALGLAISDLGALSAEILDRHDLSHSQYNVLRMLRGVGDRGLTHTEITRWMIMGVPDVTRLVDRLEKRRLVRRERDLGDRRKVLHRIQPQGRELLEAVEPHMAALHGWVTDAMSRSRREMLVELCEEIIEIAAERSGRELKS